MASTTKDLEEYIRKYLEPAINKGHHVNFLDKWIRLPNYKEIKDWDPNLTVSIVSANWGNTPVLPIHIEGFAKQDYPHGQMEVLLTDDNSPGSDKNDCITLMKKLMIKHRDLNIRFFETHKNVNWNSTVPTNIGIKRAKGDILLFCDSDTLLVGKDYVTATVKHHSQRENLWLNPLCYEVSLNKNERFEYLTKNIDDENFVNPPEHLSIICQPIMWRGGSVRRADCVRLHGLDEGLKGWGGFEGHLYERLKKDGFVGGQDYTMQTVHMWNSVFRGQYSKQIDDHSKSKVTGDLVVNPTGWGEVEGLEEIFP